MQSIRDLLCSQFSAFKNDKRLVVAYSGGLDSHVLLHGLTALRNSIPDAFGLEALHIHHGVNPQADLWVTHCQSVCDLLEVPLTVSYVQCDTSQASLENQLRNARYQAFSEFLRADDVLVLAHHGDDQAETLLLRTLRGAGPQGLSGMPVERSLGQGHLARPLLNIGRADLQAYAQQSQLNWVEDDSNADTVFDRNFLRHEVMPQLAQRWPHYRASFLRNAQVAKDARQSLDYFLTRELQPQMDQHQGGLSCSWLAGYAPAVQINLLRAWLNQCGLPLPGYRHLQQVLNEVVNARVDAQPLVNWPGVEVRRFRGAVWAMKPLLEHDAKACFTWNLEQDLVLPGAGVLSIAADADGDFYVPSGSVITVAFRQGGERCKVVGHAHSTLLKKLLNSVQLAPWLRDRLPLIYVDGELAALGDVAVCDGFHRQQGRQGYVLHWLRP